MMPELHLGQADPRAFLPVRDPVMAGQRELQAAAQAEAVDRGHGRDGQRLDPVENARHGMDDLRDFGLGPEVVELADVGAGDEAFLLAGHEDHAANALVAGAFLHRRDDGLKLLDRLAPERVLRLALDIDGGPGDPLQIDLEPPVLQVCHIRCHDRSSKTSKPRTAIARRFSAVAIPASSSRKPFTAIRDRKIHCPASLDGPG